MSQQDYRLQNLDHTQAFAEVLASVLRNDDWVLLEGPMGAGKTTLVRALVAAMDGDPLSVTSPSYALMNHYRARLMIWHVDAWRIHSDEDFAALGLDDLAENTIVLVEWPSNIPALANELAAWRVSILPAGGDKRTITVRVPPGRQLPAVIPE